MRNLAGAAIATIQDYPSIAAGSCAFLVAFSLVAGNALLGQSGGHPDPLWATRDGVTTQSVARSRPIVPVRKVRVEAVAPSDVPVPVRRPALATDPAEDRTDLVRRIQHELAQLGLYEDDVDGVFGPVTRGAILDFQRANGLQADGEASRAVLAEIAALSRRPAEAVAESDAAEPSGIGALVQKASLESDAAPAEADRFDLAESEEDIARAALIARIQIGLMNFGEAGIVVDGVLGPHTVDAIRAFQRRYGLPVNGEPDETMIRKLEQIGALQSG